MRFGYTVWPEGQPERARFARNWLHLQWFIAGPMGWKAMFQRRRMTNYWPSMPGEDHTATARMWEGAMKLHRALGEAE